MVNGLKVTLVVFSAVQAWLEGLSAAERFMVFFVTRNFTAARRIQRLLGERAERILVGESVNAVADEIRDEFRDLDACVSVSPDDLLWDCTSVAERNPYANDLFWKCCISLALLRLVRNHPESLVVLVEDPGFALFLRQLLKKNGCDVDLRMDPTTRHTYGTVAGRRTFRQTQLRCADQADQEFLREVQQRQVILRELQCKLARPRQRPKGEIDVLFVVWGTSTTFLSGELKNYESHFGELPGRFQKRGAKIAYFVHPLYTESYGKIAENALAAGDPVILPEECVGKSEILEIRKKGLARKWKVVRPLLLQGVNFTPLLREELRRERSINHSLRFLLFHYVGRYLREQGLEPKVMLMPCEFQGWEKALKRGIREACPSTKIVGYLHSPCAANWLGQYPSHRDLSECVHLDRLLVINRVWKEHLLSKGFSADLLMEGAAFRFRYLERAGVPVQADRLDPRRFLVAAPIGYNDALELVSKVVEQMVHDTDLEIWIKLHPCFEGDPDLLVKEVFAPLGVREIPQHIRFTDRPIPELLCQFQTIIHNGTSVGWEAAALGRTVIFVQSDLWLDMDTLFLFPGAQVRVRNETNLRKLIRSIANGHIPEILSHTKSDLSFVTVSENNMAPFYDGMLNLEPSGCLSRPGFPEYEPATFPEATKYRTLNWLSEGDLERMKYSTYWNDEEAERAKEWNITDGDFGKMESYLRKTGLHSDLTAAIKFLRIRLQKNIGGVGVDVAAGNLWASSYLFSAGEISMLYCVEYSRHRLLKLGPLVLEHYKIPPEKVTLAFGSFYDIRLPSGSVDFMLLAQAFHHADRPKDLLREMWRLLKPGAFAILVGEHKEPQDESLGDHYYPVEEYLELFNSHRFKIHHFQQSSNYFQSFVLIKDA
jgi:SAM-dependent methyltransferase